MRSRSRLRAAAVALVGVLAAALLTIAVPAAAGAAGTASISGTVTVPSGTTVDPYALYVEAYNASTDAWVTSTYVETGGTYTLAGLDAGSYKVRFTGQSAGLVTQWWKNKKTMSDATKIAVTAGQEKTGVNAALVKGATISGKITLPSGAKAKLTDISVSVYDATTYANVGWATVDSSGAYTAKGLPSGSVKVSFNAYGLDLVEQWWKNKRNYQDATKITLKAGAKVTGINAKLVRAAKISGKVTLPSGVKRTKDTSVFATLYTGTKESYVTGTIASSTGAYSFPNVAAGTYKILYSAINANVVAQWWGGKSTWASASKLTVKAGQTKTKVDGKLVKGATLSGKVTLPSGSGVKLTDVGVYVYRADKRQYVLGTTVSSKGTYSVDRLPAGAYKVLISPNTGKAASQWVSGKGDWSTATKYTLGAGKSKAGVNAALKIGGSVTGTVSGTAGVKNGGYVHVYRVAGDGEIEYERGAEIGKGGKYRVEGLGTGKYTVHFVRSYGNGTGTVNAPSQAGLTPVLPAPTAAAGPVRDKWWKEKPDYLTANRITVTAKKTTSGINTNLDKKPATQKLKTATPKITGTLKVGKKLTAKPGAWTEYTEFTYKWYANGKVISKATKSTFTLTSAQKGKKITVKVTGKKPYYSTVTKASKATAKIG